MIHEEEPKPTMGRIIHFVHSNGDECPGIITRAFDDYSVNLQLFLDHGQMGTHDGRAVPFDPDGISSPSWHWPQRQPALIPPNERNVYRAGRTTEAPVGKVDLHDPGEQVNALDHADPSSPEMTSAAVASTIANDADAEATTAAGDIATNGDGTRLPDPTDAVRDALDADDESVGDHDAADDALPGGDQRVGSVGSEVALVEVTTQTSTSSASAVASFGNLNVPSDVRIKL